MLAATITVVPAKQPSPNKRANVDLVIFCANDRRRPEPTAARARGAGCALARSNRFLLASAFVRPGERTAENATTLLREINDQKPVSVEKVVFSTLINDPQGAVPFRGRVGKNPIQLVKLERGQVTRVIDAHREARARLLGHG